MNYAVHGTCLGDDNLKFSADVPGSIRREATTRLGYPVLFSQGCLGDVDFHLYQDVVATALKVGMGRYVEDDVEIATRAAALPDFPLTRQPDLRAMFHTGRDGDS